MDFEIRKKLWLALSELYLDTKITERTLNSIVKTAKKDNVTFETLYKINKEEVFPVLFKNGLSATGVWTGFEESWLIETISKSLNQSNWMIKKYNSLIYLLFSTLIATSLKRLELLFKENI